MAHQIPQQRFRGLSTVPAAQARRRLVTGVEMENWDRQVLRDSVEKVQRP
jgi:hypothetical protein